MTLGYIEKDFTPPESDLQKINSFTRSEFTADRLYVFSAALCNNDIDRDYERFSTDALRQLAKFFIGKTFICDHSMKASDQKARIFDAWVEKVNGRKTADGEDFYQLKAKAYMVRNDENAGLITEIEAGIKKEVSVSCSMGKSLCSVCGRDKRSGRCEHIPGKKYNGKTAFTVLSDVKDAYEISFVAVPAQREAGVTKSAKIFKEDTAVTDVINKMKNCCGAVTLTADQARDIVKEIDALSEEAALGREYKNNLTNEVIALCAKAMPQMDIATFSSVAKVMTTKELLSFKKAFNGSSAAPQISPQIKPEKSGADSSNYSNYKI